MTDLSPAAQAVLDAVEDDCIHPSDLHRIAAAALRAAADQVVPASQSTDRPDGDGGLGPGDRVWDDWTAGVIRECFLVLATELETIDG